VVFHRVLEFSDGFLVLRVDDGSPRPRYFLHYGCMVQYQSKNILEIVIPFCE